MDHQEEVMISGAHLWNSILLGLLIIGIIVEEQLELHGHLEQVGSNNFKWLIINCYGILSYSELMVLSHVTWH